MMSIGRYFNSVVLVLFCELKYRNIPQSRCFCFVKAPLKGHKQAQNKNDIFIVMLECHVGG
jgi:hypothetical protein